MTVPLYRRASALGGILANAGESDTTDPEVSSFDPADDSIGHPPGANLTIVFNEAVNVGTGNVSIYLVAGDVLVEDIDVTSGQVTGGGTDTITVNPSSDLLENTAYYVQIDATAFDDLAGNSYAGISGTTTWNFTTGINVVGGANAPGGSAVPIPPRQTSIASVGLGVPLKQLAATRG